MSIDQKQQIPIPEEKFIDYAKCTQNPDIMRKLDAKKQEKVVFSCVAKKKNRYGIDVDRTLMITDLCVYNLEKKAIGDKHKINRCINLRNIEAFTKTEDRQCLSFVIHISTEYDISFTSLPKYGAGFLDNIRNALQYVIAMKKQINLPIYVVKAVELSHFITSKKDQVAGIDRKPKETLRNEEWDRYPQLKVRVEKVEPPVVNVVPDP